MKYHTIMIYIYIPIHAHNTHCLIVQVTGKMASMSVNDQQGHGTIKAPASIDAEADAQVLRKAMKGMGTCCLASCIPGLNNCMDMDIFPVNDGHVA